MNNVSNFNKIYEVLSIELSSIWHRRLGHINLKKLKRMTYLGLVLKAQTDFKQKCEIFVQTKQSKKLYKSIDRNTQVLELVHNDVCDFNRPHIRERNKYFVTSIDDCLKYCYLFFIKTEVFYKF